MPSDGCSSRASCLYHGSGWRPRGSAVPWLPGSPGEDNGKDNRETSKNQNSQLDEIIFAFFLHDGPSCWYRLASSWLRAGSGCAPASFIRFAEDGQPYAGPEVCGGCADGHCARRCPIRWYAQPDVFHPKGGCSGRMPRPLSATSMSRSSPSR